MSVVTILHRTIKWRFHNAFTIVITIVQPILWLVLYSSVASQTMKQTGINEYTAFILPGLIVLLCFGTCSSSGIMNYLMKTDGSFYRVLLAPIKRSAIVLGQLLEAVLCSFLEIMIMVIVSMLLGVDLVITGPILIVSMLLVWLTSLFVAGFCYGMSLILPNEVLYETVMNAIVLPIFFLSTALFPAEELDGVLFVMIHCNPFTYVINALRSMMIDGEIAMDTIGFVFVLFLLVTCMSFLFAYHRLKKETSI